MSDTAPRTAAGRALWTRVQHVVQKRPTTEGIVDLHAILAIENEAASAAREELAAQVRAFLDVVSAAEALGWDWYSGMKRVKALHPISGDLMSAHARLALAIFAPVPTDPEP